MKRIYLLALLPSLLLSAQAMAESTRYRCVYLESTYDAAFMNKPGTRSCAANRCFYDLVVDEAAKRASVNGVPGYGVDSGEASLLLSRASKNIVMGGTDTATFTIDRKSLRFVGKKTTTPSVTLTTQGQCEKI